MSFLVNIWLDHVPSTAELTPEALHSLSNVEVPPLVGEPEEVNQPFFAVWDAAFEPVPSNEPRSHRSGRRGTYGVPWHWPDVCTSLQIPVVSVRPRDIETTLKCGFGSEEGISLFYYAMLLCFVN